MRNSIKDLAMLPLIEQQLKASSLNILESIIGFKDVEIGEHQLAVYHSTLSTTMRVFDAWVIHGLGSTTFCNQENYPTINEAVAYHVGGLIVSGACKVVVKEHAKRRKNNV